MNQMTSLDRLIKSVTASEEFSKKGSEKYIIMITVDLRLLIHMYEFWNELIFQRISVQYRLYKKDLKNPKVILTIDRINT